MAIWPPIVDDDGTGTTGTATDYALFQQIKGYIDAADAGGSTATVQLAIPGTINNLALPQTDVVVILTNVAITLTGFAAARDGQLVIIRSGSSTVTLPNNGASAKPLFNVATSAPTILLATGVAAYVCVSGFYCLMQHQQGARSAVPFSAANFTGGIDVDAGDVIVQAWQLEGRYLQIDIALATVSVNTATANINIGGWPYDFVAAGAYSVANAQYFGGPWANWMAVPAGRVIQFYKSDAVNVATGANGLSFHFNGRFFVV